MRRGSGTRSSRGEAGRVDDVAAVARERHAVARFVVGRTRLRVLAGEATDAHHRQAQPVHEHEAHLQQHLQAVGDHVRIAFGEVLRAIAALQQEALAFLRFGQVLLERDDFPRGDERRQRAQFVAAPACSATASGYDGHLQRRARAPAVGRPVGGKVDGMQGAIGLGHGRRRNVAVRRSHHGAGDRSPATGAAAAPFSGGGMRRTATQTASAARTTAALHAGIDMPRKVQSTFAHSPEPVSTWLHDVGERAGFHHEIQRRAAGGHLVRRQGASATRGGPRCRCRRARGSSAMPPSDATRPSRRAARYRPPSRNTRPSTPNAMRWKMHSGHGLRYQCVLRVQREPDQRRRMRRTRAGSGGGRRRRRL